MGFLQMLTQKTAIKESILPLPARNQILCGNLPNIAASRILLRKGEVCHYVDRAIRNVHKTRTIGINQFLM